MASRPSQDAVRSVLYDSLRSLSLSLSLSPLSLSLSLSFIDLLYSLHLVPPRTLCDPFSTTHSTLSLSLSLPSLISLPLSLSLSPLLIYSMVMASRPSQDAVRSVLYDSLRSLSHN